MKTTFKFWSTGRALIAAIGIFAICASAGAADDLQEARKCDLRIAAGEKGKGFSNLLRDINEVCSNEVNLCPVETDGSFTTVNLLAQNQADIGMATVDILSTLRNTDDAIANLQSVFPLNYNLVHVVTRAGGRESTVAIQGKDKYFGMVKGDVKSQIVRTQVTKFSELKGKTIALVGSARIVGPMLERSLAYGMKFVDVDKDEQAQQLVKDSKVDAYMTISGYPNGKIMAFNSRSGFALVPYDLQPSAPYVIVRKNYSNMGVINNPFLASPSMLVTRPFKQSGELGKKVATLQSCMTRNIDKLQEGGSDWKIAPQPGWNEIKNTSESFGFTRYTASAAVKSKK